MIGQMMNFHFALSIQYGIIPSLNSFSVRRRTPEWKRPRRKKRLWTCETLQGQRGIQARRREAYLDQVAQDLRHPGGIGDDGQHSHFRVAARTDQPIDLIHFSDQSHALPRYEGSGDGRARLVIVAYRTCAQGRQPFRWERREPA